MIYTLAEDFADDTSLYIIVDKPISATDELNALPDNTKNSRSVESFKHKLNKKQHYQTTTLLLFWFTTRTTIACPHMTEM